MRFSSEENIVETPYQPAPLPSQLYDHHQRSTTTRLHSYDPLTLLESEVRNPIITGSNTCDLGGLGGGGGRQPRNNSYHPDHHRSSTTYYDHNGGSGVLSGTTSHHLSSSGSRIVDLVPRSVQESDYAILTFPPPPPAIDLLNESMASTSVTSGALGSTNMLNAMTPGVREMQPLPNPAMGKKHVYKKNLNGHYMYYLWNKIEQLQPSPNHGMGRKYAFKKLQFYGIFQATRGHGWLKVAV